MTRLPLPRWGTLLVALASPAVAALLLYRDPLGLGLTGAESVAAVLLVLLTALVIGRVWTLGARVRALTASLSRAEGQAARLEAELPFGVLLVDRTGRILRTNRAARTLLYTEAPEEFGLSLGDLLSPESWPTMRQHLQSPRAGVRFRATVAAATPVAVEWTLAPASEEGSGRLRATIRCANEEFRMEGETRALAGALRCLHDGVVMLDLDGVIRYANPAAFRLWGIAHRSSFRGAELAGFIAPEDREHFLHRLADARTLSDEGELRLLRPDGAATEVQLSLSPVRVDGEELGIVAVVRDLTATREMIRQATTLDHRASLGRLVAGAAHEIGDPLTAIAGTVELAEHDPALPAELRAHLEVIRTSCHRAGKVLHGLVDFARQAPTDRAAAELAEVVEKAVAIRRGYAAAAGIELTFHASSPAPVAIDPERIGDVVLELLANAEEAVAGAEEKRISVTIGRRRGMALLMVSDSGPGVPTELTERVFEPFFTTHTTRPGAGVGLAMVAGVVGAHGGRVSVGRGALGGAQFAVELPLSEAAPTRVPGPVEHRRNDRPESLEILVVDDDPAVLGCIGRVLRRLGHTVHLAATGESAVRLATRHHVDVIISDLRMPGMSGRQLHARLTEEGILPAAEFLVATGDGADPEAVAFLQATGLPVIHKPFEIPALVEMLSRLRPAQRQIEVALEQAG